MDIENFVTITKALSDPNRVRGLLALRNGELCICQITELLNLAPSTVSKHMSVLKQADLVTSRKDSRWVYFRLSEQNTQAIDDFLKITTFLLEHDAQIAKDTLYLNSMSNTGITEKCNNKQNDI